jgi:hypothetical protein
VMVSRQILEVVVVPTLSIVGVLSSSLLLSCQAYRCQECLPSRQLRVAVFRVHLAQSPADGVKASMVVNVATVQLQCVSVTSV